jgi:2-polyprenyl-3-methyl-5-hydroxy-6-metoxy-1,4-benzoquinol methylase
MRRVQESEIESDFERQLGWGDDERYYYHKNQRKSSVMGYFLRFETVINLAKKLPPGSRIADLACGQGNFALTLAELGFDVTAVDIKPEFLNYAKKKYTHGKINFVHQNLMEYRDQDRFDCILMGEIIEHVAFPDQLLQTAYENLKPGGLLIITTPNGGEYAQPLPTYKQVTHLEELIPRQFHWGDHLFLYTEDELRELVENQGFKIQGIEKLNSSYVGQIKGIRYLFPLRALKWMERKTRSWKKKGKDSTNCLILSAQKRS